MSRGRGSLMDIKKHASGGLSAADCEFCPSLEYVASDTDWSRMQPEYMYIMVLVSSDKIFPIWRMVEVEAGVTVNHLESGCGSHSCFRHSL